MIFHEKTREEQMRWKKHFAFFPVQIGTNIDGTAKMRWMCWYEVRWTGLYQYPGICMERRLPNSEEVCEFVDQ